VWRTFALRTQFLLFGNLLSRLRARGDPFELVPGRSAASLARIHAAIFAVMKYCNMNYQLRTVSGRLTVEEVAPKGKSILRAGRQLFVTLVLFPL